MSRLGVLRQSLALGRALEDALRCPQCLKSRVQLNVAGYRQPVRLAPVTPETHCTCAPAVPPVEEDSR